MTIGKRHALAAVITAAAVVVGTGVTAAAAPGTAALKRGARAAAPLSLLPADAPVLPLSTPFGPDSTWRQDVSRAPLHPNSAGMVANIAEQAAKYYGGIAAFNVNRYSTSFYKVKPGTPRVDVKWNNCQKKPWVPAGLLGPGGQFTQVPIPADAVPAAGTDGQLTVWSPETDQLWEFWVAKKVGGDWTACWGGRIDGVSRNPGYFSGGFGASASGMSVAGGTVGIREVQAGRIEHALMLQLVDTAMWDNFSWPAQRSDGHDKSPNAVPEGTRLRLDPRVDVDALPLTPVAKMIARAAQKYGFIVTDKAGCVAVVGESPAAAIAATGRNPWPALLKGKPDYLVMQGFPWDKLQALPRDYGKPGKG